MRDEWAGRPHSRFSHRPGRGAALRVSAATTTQGILHRRSRLRYDPGQRCNVDSKKLKTWQAERIGNSILPTLAYLNKLVQRMEKTGFPVDDPLFLSALKAQDALFDLRVKLHYLSCSSGVGEKPAE